MFVKKILFPLFLVLMIVSCDNSNIITEQINENALKFSFNQATFRDEYPSKVYVSIIDNNGSIVHELKCIDLLNFQGNFISEPIALYSGDYELTAFLVADEQNNVLYATPMENSPFGHLVEDPLNIDFSIESDVTLNLAPEVISTNGANPSDFGYTTFSFQIIDHIEFYVSTFAYDENSNNLELTDANISVSITNANNDTTEIYSGDLQPITNLVAVNDGYENYIIKIEKERYFDYFNSFTNEALADFINEPLIVVLIEDDNTNTDGLVAYYPFTGNTNDYSGFDNHGVGIALDLRNDRFGNENSAYYFNGYDSQVDCGSSDILDIRTTVSIEISFKVDQFSNVFTPLVYKGYINGGYNVFNGDERTYSLWLDCTGRLHLTSADEFGQEQLDLDANSIQTNSWYHYVGIIDRSTGEMKAYLNGELVETGSIRQNMAVSSPRSLLIGASHEIHPRFSNFNGTIDDVRIFNRALTQDEVVSLYAGSRSIK